MAAAQAGPALRAPRFDTAAIGRYYDRHTSAFIKYGQGGGAGVIHRAVWGHRTTTWWADYCDLPASVGRADLAYAIEAFVHGPAPDRFFVKCGRLVRPGGLLVICDDIRRAAAGAAAARALDRFCRGWRINALLHQDELRALARTAGFEHQSTIDLSAALEIGRARDRRAGCSARPTPARYRPLRSPAGRRRPSRNAWPTDGLATTSPCFDGSASVRGRSTAKRGHDRMMIRDSAEPWQR